MHTSVVDNIDQFCKSKPGTVRPHPTNCAQYYNCSQTSVQGDHLFECPYPDLFDSSTLLCRNFTTVPCGKRQEPMAPCKKKSIDFNFAVNCHFVN